MNTTLDLEKLGRLIIKEAMMLLQPDFPSRWISKQYVRRCIVEREGFVGEIDITHARKEQPTMIRFRLSGAAQGTNWALPPDNFDATVRDIAMCVATAYDAYAQDLAARSAISLALVSERVKNKLPGSSPLCLASTGSFV